MNGQHVSEDTGYAIMFKVNANEDYGAIFPGWYCSNLDSSDLTVCHAGSNGKPIAYFSIQPKKRYPVSFTGMYNSEDGPHDFEELSSRLK